MVLIVLWQINKRYFGGEEYFWKLAPLNFKLFQKTWQKSYLILEIIRNYQYIYMLWLDLMFIKYQQFLAISCLSLRKNRRCSRKLLPGWKLPPVQYVIFIKLFHSFEAALSASMTELVNIHVNFFSISMF